MATRADVDTSIRERIESGQQAEAVTETVRGFGPEILDFLCAMHRNDPAAADEVFSLWAEGVWRGLGAFAWQCSLRTWCYAVARHASLRYRRDQQRRSARHIPVAEVAGLLDLADEARSATPWYCQSALRDRFTALRARLSADDQLLLLLRVDRGMAWNDIARVMLHVAPEMPLPAADVTRTAVRLRKHFQSVKARLYRLGREHGLLATDAGQAPHDAVR